MVVSMLGGFLYSYAKLQVIFFFFRLWVLCAMVAMAAVFFFVNHENTLQL